MKIKKLTLFTSNLQQQKKFYTKVLGLPKVEANETSVCFHIGYTHLEFKERKQATPYHFAINIPPNKDHEALDWLKQRVEILPDGDNEMVDFSNWNANAMYFYDADKNIVELIARRDINIHSDGPFGQQAFLEVSEIGMATENIERKYHILNRDAGLEIYDGGFGRFCAIGDEHGLIICINKNLKKWFPVDDTAYSSNFELTMDEGGNQFELGFKNDELSVNAVSNTIK